MFDDKLDNDPMPVTADEPAAMDAEPAQEDSQATVAVADEAAPAEADAESAPDSEGTPEEGSS